MTAQILDGKKLAQIEQLKLKQTVEHLKAAGLSSPSLTVILVGEQAASKIYVKHKMKACEEIGVISTLVSLPAEIAESDLLDIIIKLNQDQTVHGILVQLPLPVHIQAERVLRTLSPAKDVDGFHPVNMGLLALKIPALAPATPKGIMMLLDHYIGTIAGMNAVVVGASNIVGRPMLLELLNRRATVTVCHSQTRNLVETIKNADLVVAAVGIPHFIKAHAIKKGAIVVDVGINRLAEGKIVGDVDFAAVATEAAWISPVPGGVGPMTIIGLLYNLLQACQTQHQQELK